MGEADLYIHAGIKRTATTYIQKSVLENVQSLKYIFKPSIEVEGAKIFFSSLFQLSPLVWSEIEENPFTKKGGERTVRDTIVSDEDVCGGLAPSRSWIPNRRPKFGCPDPHLVFRHLQELKDVASNWGYERVRVLLSTRRQDTRLASGYAQSSNRVRGAGQQDFERWVRHLLDTTVGFYEGRGVKLDYSVWYEELSRAVGQENVFFLPFELLQENEPKYLKRWLGFIEEETVDSIVKSVSSSGKRNSQSASSGSKWFVRDPMRTGLNLRPTRVFQALGLPTKLSLPRLDFQRDDEIRLTKYLTEKILDVYEGGNRLLDDRDPSLNLEKYGYY